MIMFALVVFSAFGCQRVCTDLAHMHFDVELDEPYDASSQFQYDVGAAKAPNAATSCGDLEMGVRDFQVQTPQPAPDCFLYWGTLTGLDEPSGRTTVEADRYTNSRALMSVWSQDIVAERSRVTLGGVCPGIYTVVLRRTVYDGDDLRAPVPGELPPWVVVRSFEAQGSCPMLGLAENGVCSDVWAAHLTGLSHL